MKIFKFFLLFIILSIINGKKLRFTQNLNMESVLKQLPKKGFSTVLNKINLIVGMWENIATTFSTKITNVMEKYLPGLGFDKFKSSCHFRISIGLKLNKYKLWTKSILKNNNVPSKFVDLFSENICDAEYIDQHVYGDFDMLFNKNNPKNDKVNFIHLMSYRDGNENKITVIYTHSNADFKLSPNTIIMRKNKFIAGGAYTSSIPYNIVKPKDITKEDMELIMKFFSFSMIKMMAQSLGIKLKTIGPK